MRLASSRPAERVAIVIALAGVVVPPASAQQTSLKDEITGTWTLVSEHFIDKDGRRIERFGSNPKGLVIYDRSGRFAAIFLRSDLPMFAGNSPMTGTAEENRAVVQGSRAIFGTWRVDEADRSYTVLVEGSVFPNLEGQELKRDVSLAGDEMKLCSEVNRILGCAVLRRVK